MGHEGYPWFGIVKGEEIEQGDLLEDCPVYSPSEELAGFPNVHIRESEFQWEEYDTVVMSQSCDMVKGREKISHVLLCPVFGRSDYTQGHLATPKGMEDARRGGLPAYHVLAECYLPGFKREIRVVDFRCVYSLPLAYVRRWAAERGERIRILPPYREHLSQSFARYFMRVGLPVDIPPFR